MSDILEFQGEHRWLSNFYPCSVLLDGMEFKTVEAAYVAAKTLDIALRQTIQKLETPGQAKRYGRGMALRADWDEVKLSVMELLLRQKFAAGTSLAAKLQETGEGVIVEGNKWGDTFWGVCEGRGANHLGRLIMQIRSDLRVNEMTRAY